MVGFHRQRRLGPPGAVAAEGAVLVPAARQGAEPQCGARGSHPPQPPHCSTATDPETRPHNGAEKRMMDTHPCAQFAQRSQPRPHRRVIIGDCPPAPCIHLEQQRKKKAIFVCVFFILFGGVTKPRGVLRPGRASRASQAAPGAPHGAAAATTCGLCTLGPAARCK